VFVCMFLVAWVFPSLWYFFTLFLLLRAFFCFGGCVFVCLFLVSVCCEGRLVWGMKCAGWLLFWYCLLRCVCFVCEFCIFVDFVC